MFTFDLVTPEKLVSSQEVSQVVIPGTDGDFGVLEAHCQLISTIQSGVLNIYVNDDNTISKQIFVTGGFAEVTADRCTVLATEAFDLDQYSKSDAEKLLTDLQEKLEISISEDSKNLLTIEINNIEKLVKLCK